MESNKEAKSILAKLGYFNLDLASIPEITSRSLKDSLDIIQFIQQTKTYPPFWNLMCWHDQQRLSDRLYENVQNPLKRDIFISIHLERVRQWLIEPNQVFPEIEAVSLDLSVLLYSEAVKQETINDYVYFIQPIRDDKKVVKVGKAIDPAHIQQVMA